MQKPSWGKYFFVLIVATTVTALTVFLGTPLLRVLRNVFGSAKYWIGGVLVVAGLLALGPGAVLLAVLIGSLWISVGLYQELEEQGKSGFWTAALSVTAGSAVLIFGPQIWSHFMGANLLEELKAGIQDLTQQIAGTKAVSEYGISTETVVRMLPSIVVLLHLVGLAFALMLDSRYAQLVGLKTEKIASQMRLLEFRIPEVFIWLTMASFLLSFLKIENEGLVTAALNVFNVMMGLYFFQGLAVLEVSFLVFRVGSFVRFLIYFIVVGQLFILFSAVGIIDYWADFRQKLKKWRMPERSQKNGENI